MSWWDLFGKHVDKADFVKAFLLQNQKPIPAIRSLDQLEFTVFDTETTGLSIKEDYVLSFGGVKIRNAAIQIETAIELYPTSPKSGKKTASIHGLVQRENQIQIRDFANQSLEYFCNSILVAHHIGFDTEMMQKACRPFGLEKLPNPMIDTMTMAIRLELGPHADRSQINPSDFGLDSLCKRYQIPTEDRHTAAGDAFLTAQLFLKFLKIAQGKGITNFGQLTRKGF
ncbi:DNA polymerase-3 subunit epsilon [Algoriphagus ratkowskyi]|uniref:3'-5' exonuclease n=1 Tax=Algoriphagus ratkowskyi TaxID=57028 RepID=A0A2W7RBS8_9BACT|nr:3'-5' exonuclease [Algoriphagus ratkowskyi]PZX58378.1 DNA polymerase-3 subunit epsilon [Algoriphagus ratkowskyi]TXD77754.1 3'-5' exonuclease [Algoriphagus ratkowskyi]